MRVSEKTGCNCVYCRGTKDDLSNYAAELELLAYGLLQDLKKFAGHDGDVCGFTFAKGKPQTFEHRIGVADNDHCNCGLDASIKGAENDFVRLNGIASKRHGRKLRRRKS